MKVFILKVFVFFSRKYEDKTTIIANYGVFIKKVYKFFVFPSVNEKEN